MDFKKINEKKQYNDSIPLNYNITDGDIEYYKKNIHQYNRFVINRFRFSSASTKSRSEISCTGAKAYKQKGTGNARRGRNSSNLRRGGYRAFGPSPRYFNFSLNKKLIKKMYKLMFLVNSEKITVIDNNLLLDKTKDAYNLLNKYNLNSKVLLLTSVEDNNFIKPFRNLKNIKIDDISIVTPESITISDTIILSENTFNKLKDKFQ